MNPGPATSGGSSRSPRARRAAMSGGTAPGLFPRALARGMGAVAREVAEGEAGDDVGGDVPRLLAERLGQRHGAVRLVVAELGVLSLLDERRIRGRIIDEAGERGVEFLLEEVEQIHRGQASGFGAQ